MRNQSITALFLFFFLAETALAQHKNVSTAAEPQWVTHHEYTAAGSSLDKYAEEGNIDLAFESVVNIGEATEYQHHVKKIVSESGVQNASEVSVAFDPSYQHLILHSLRIIRGKESVSKLSLSALKVIQREEDRRSFIYNGEMDAVSVLEDVRVGDIIDYSYSIRGFNPIFKGKYAAFFSTGFSIPVYDLYYKIIVPQTRTVYIKRFNDSIEPVVAVSGSNKTYEWTRTNIRPLKMPDKTPGWYDPYPQFMVTEFSSWKELNEWALQLFPKHTAISPALAALIKKTDAENTTAAAKVQAALRFVQDEIRYMGFEMGEHSHKPAEPSKVLAQRFGDCKEKSYLLCTMLDAMHIEANPVLINTAYKNTISSWLPATINFDHVVTRVLLDGAYYYFDPTIPYQRGDIKQLFFPDYQVGLVVADSTKALTAILYRNTSSVEVKNEFTVAEMYGEGYLKVITANKGSFADDARYSFNNTSNSELLNSYKKFYAAYFPDIIADSLNTADDDSTGIFTTTEYYTIPKFWSKEKDYKKLSVAPFVILSNLVTTTDKQRSMPLRLNYPAVYRETIKINLPENWKFTPGELHVKNSCFTYNFKSGGMLNKAFIEAEYETSKNNVSPEEMKQYFADVDKIDDHSTWDFTYGDKTAEEKDAIADSRKRPLLPFVIVIGVVFGLIYWSQKRR